MAKTGPKVGSKNHSDFEQAAGVMLLAANKMDYALTAKMLNISVDTLRYWEKIYSAKKEAIPIMLENAIRKLLEMMPDKWNGNTWAIAFGILMDKWLLVNGQPTQRTENVISELDNLNDEEKDEVVREAERIISGAISRGNNSNSPEA